MAFARASAGERLGESHCSTRARALPLSFSFFLLLQFFCNGVVVLVEMLAIEGERFSGADIREQNGACALSSPSPRRAAEPPARFHCRFSAPFTRPQ